MPRSLMSPSSHADVQVSSHPSQADAAHGRADGDVGSTQVQAWRQWLQRLFPAADTSLAEAASMRWPGLCYAAMAMLACAFAFVGLSASSFWIDELFTVHVIHHQGGLGEVFRLALTDVHPPLYYFFLYEWSRLFGFSEWSLRLPSALLGVLAVLLFAQAARHVSRGTGVAFACAAATISTFWFDQSQNARSYMLALTLAACMLDAAIALYRHTLRHPRVFPGGQLALLTAIGLAASLTHAYLLLATGMVWLFMLLSVPDWRLRIALLITGPAILLPNLLYFHWLMHSTQLDLHHLWFQNSVDFFSEEILHALVQLLAKWIIAIGLLLLLARWLLRRLVRSGSSQATSSQTAPETRWAIGLCLCVLVGVIVCGIGVSILIAPSFSDRNLLTCAPFAWLLLAIAYDAYGPRRRTLVNGLVAGLIVLALVGQLSMIRGRWLPRNDPWRASADYVAQLPGCAGQALPVVLPFNFSPATPAFRTLTEREFFGYYLPPSSRPAAYLPSELAGPQALPQTASLIEARSQRAGVSGSCLLLAWGVHDVDEPLAMQMAQDMARQTRHPVIVQEFDKFIWRRLSWVSRSAGYVLLLAPDASAGSPPPVPAKALDPGSRLIVPYVPVETAMLGRGGASAARMRHAAQ